MPGKVNPTQCEAMTMVCAQVRSPLHALDRIDVRVVTDDGDERLGPSLGGQGLRLSHVSVEDRYNLLGIDTQGAH